VYQLLALAAAVAFALGSVLQQKGGLEVDAGGNDPRFLVQILSHPIWLAGGGCQMAGWILQAVALDKGPLIVVQSLTTLSLVIALPFGRRLTDQVVTRRVWAGAAAATAGIIIFLSAGSPSGGTSNTSASAWWRACLSVLVIVVALGLVGFRRDGAVRALMLGSAAGVGFALQASVTKVFVTLVGHGLSTIISSWTTYVLIASAVVGFVLQQAALKTGILAPAVASSNAVTLAASVVLGITIFNETIAGDHLAPAVIGLAITLAGIALLAGAQAPPRPVPAVGGG